MFFLMLWQAMAEDLPILVRKHLFTWSITMHMLSPIFLDTTSTHEHYYTDTTGGVNYGQQGFGYGEPFISIT